MTPTCSISSGPAPTARRAGGDGETVSPSQGVRIDGAGDAVVGHLRDAVQRSFESTTSVATTAMTVLIGGAGFPTRRRATPPGPLSVKKVASPVVRPRDETAVQRVHDVAHRADTPAPTVVAARSAAAQAAFHRALQPAHFPTVAGAGAHAAPATKLRMPPARG